MNEPDEIVQTVLRQYPDTQAIYLFGSYGTEDEWPDSDVDIALLLPPEQAKANRMLAITPLCAELGSLTRKARGSHQSARRLDRVSEGDHRVWPAHSYEECLCR